MRAVLCFMAKTWKSSNTTLPRSEVSLRMVPRLSGRAISITPAVDTLLASIRGKLWPLGDDVAFIAGHGPMSTFGEERRSNPFCAD